ncbi:hypothetical protein SAMN05421641_1082 [Paracoccus thiocyanatus]|uniref:Uncharacterized protein n=1 Tax=Paracoccus thiocyanatus TaxID=34006 RepID=A0A1N6STR1_9RHOB|nr:hypothetical protein [Paracoccus thiocyanatus]SIQ44543.1 hypothetical protein SAMN05421641_1082 [Paracoccus thiocyanatus]
MTPPLSLLKQAKAELIALRADAALQKIQKFEKILERSGLDSACAQKCENALHDIQALASAASEGVAAAKRQLVEIASLSRRLETYDERGRRVGNAIRNQHEGRF